MARRNLDLWLITALAAGGAAVHLGPMPDVVRAVFGLPLVLVCPGYALLCAFFPGRPTGWPERALLTVGLSLAVAILGAVALNASLWGLQTTVWVILFGSVTVLASLIGAVRRRDLNAAVIDGVSGGALAWPQWVLFGIAALLTVGAVTLARAPRPATKVLGYTLLWLVPDKQDANIVQLGLSSSELSVTQYRLMLTLDGGRTRSEQDITLAPGEKWERRVVLPSGPERGDIEAVLYRVNVPGAGAVYRRAVLPRASQRP
jgi:hypothetical protein